MSPETKNIYQNMVFEYYGEFCTYSVPQHSVLKMPDLSMALNLV